MSASINPTGLTPGVYKGQVNLTAAGASNSPIAVPVTLTVVAAPGLTAAPAALTFASQVNGAAPANQTITLRGTDGSGLPVSSVSTSSGAWLTVTGSVNTTPATLTVSINPAGLAAGTHHASIVISSPAAQNSPIIVPVAFTLAAQPSLTSSAPAASFAAGIGGAAPLPVEIAIKSTGAPLVFSSGVAAGAPWLVVTGSGTTPSPIRIAVNPTGLVAGRYGGAVLVTSPSAANSPVVIPVDLLVSGAPLLTATPASLAFVTGPAGSALPQTIRVITPGSPLPVSAAASPATPWLMASGSGFGAADIIVSVNTTGLAPGTYQGAVQIVASGAANSPASIPVILQINAAPVLQASSTSLNFSFDAGGPSPPPQDVSVTLGGQPASGARASVAPGASWLSVQGSGAQMTIRANPTGLTTGIYRGTVSIIAEGAGNSPVVVPVAFTVAGFPEFETSQDAIAFVAVRAQSQPMSTTVTLTSGNQPISFELNLTASAWLSVTPLTGTTPADLTIRVDPTGLRTGSYNGSIIASSSGRRLRTLLVNLVVADAPTVSSSPPFLTFSYLRGGDTPAPVNLWVGRFGASVSVTAAPSEPWLIVDPSSPTTQGPVRVSVSPAGLSAGVHRAFVTLTATGTVGTTPVTATKRVPVTLYIDQPANPQITSVLNGMSFLNTPLAPGLIFSIFGAGIGPETPAGLEFQPDGTLSQSTGGVEVLVNGIPCPLLYVSARQINAIVPYAVFNRTSAQVAVRYLGILSSEFSAGVSPALPGLFSSSLAGVGPGAILNQDQSVNSPANTAVRESVIALFGGGGGQTSPQGVDGSINSAPPSPNLLEPVSVFIGGIQATDISYAGAAPGLPDGTLQINVRIPDSVPSGNVPVVIRIGDAISQGGLTVSVR